MYNVDDGVLALVGALLDSCPGRRGGWRVLAPPTGLLRLFPLVPSTIWWCGWLVLWSHRIDEESNDRVG